MAEKKFTQKEIASVLAKEFAKVEKLDASVMKRLNGNYIDDWHDDDFRQEMKRLHESYDEKKLTIMNCAVQFNVSQDVWKEELDKALQEGAEA